MGNDTATNVSAGILVILGGVVLISGLAALNGFMLTYLWEWFVVPFGLPAIGIIHAIGIAILVSMLTHKASANDDEEGMKRLFISIGGKMFAFGIAFVLSFWMPS